MAIAFDASSEHDTGGTIPTGFSFSHTCSGTERLLLVWVIDIGSNDTAVTGITYNGDAMTRLGEVSDGSNVVEGWYLVNPDTGTNTVSVSQSAGRRSVAYGLSYTGCSGTQPDSLKYRNEFERLNYHQHGQCVACHGCPCRKHNNC